jgi:Gas vesicle protein G
MLLIDDLLLAPFRGFFFVLREIENAARAELLAERGRIVSSLAALNRELEEGRLSETEFEVEEQALLQRLERLAQARVGDGGRGSID